ncbi:hypothetical protein WN944_019005 [Citrus x changshan-huyou]|uniref:Uncharacterized protein n=1 Tax=Citrus x changshan-huyou TaxID=2935761 RepID=A0AAP0QDM7_9ROSI
MAFKEAAVHGFDPATFPYGYLVIKESVVSEQPRLVDQSLTVERATRLSDPTTRAPEPEAGFKCALSRSESVKDRWSAPAPNGTVLLASRSQLSAG